jgi:alpha-galactosidase
LFFTALTGADSLQQYTKFSDALNKTGREVVFALCGIASQYYPNASSVGNMWRIGMDGFDWNNALTNIDAAVGKSHLAGPGGWNDPCMLISRWVTIRMVTLDFQ